MKFLKGLFGFLLVVALLVVGLGGYFGIIPGVSKIFGSDKPKDLGMVYSEANYQSGTQKSGSSRGALPSDTPITAAARYEGSHTLNTTFTDDELTSFSYNRPWVNYPFKNLQIRIQDNGRVELSGYVRMTKMVGYLNTIGVSSADLNKVMTDFHVPMADVPMYMSGTASVKNNKVTGNIDSLEVGRVPVPISIIKQYQQPAIELVDHALSIIPGLNIEEANFGAGGVTFKGTIPDKELTVYGN